VAWRAMSRRCQIEVIFLLLILVEQACLSVCCDDVEPKHCRRREVVLASAFRRVLPGSSDSASISGGLQVEPAPGLPYETAQRPLHWVGWTLHLKRPA
jgi:hypothetical protein